MLLPKLSGSEVLRALRKHPVTHETPIIVLSGFSQANEKKLKEDGAPARDDPGFAERRLRPRSPDPRPDTPCLARRNSYMIWLQAALPREAVR
jgi:CheY-like chemotaxis protein